MFLAIREEAKDLLVSISVNEPSAETAFSAFKSLSEKYITACTLAPQTTNDAVEDASTAIEEGESTVTERERELLCGSIEGGCR